MVMEFMFGQLFCLRFKFPTLFVIIRTQFVKEKSKFLNKFGTLNSERAILAKSQIINKEILSNSSNI